MDTENNEDQMDNTGVIGIGFDARHSMLMNRSHHYSLDYL
jgi:hypothetical protein